MNKYKTIFMYLTLTGLIMWGTFSAGAQVPDSMTYQMVIRGTNNELHSNATLKLLVEILKGQGMQQFYTEEHLQVNTNANGLATIVIGSGTRLSFHNFRDIDWSDGPYFLRTSYDFGTGTYTVNGTQQLLTVPYAFYAGNSEHSQTAHYADSAGNVPVGANGGDLLYWNTGTNSWTLIPAGMEGTVLTMGPNQVPTWNTPGTLSNNPPTIVTVPVSNIGKFSASSGGIITDAGSAGVNISGICWSKTHPYPTTNDPHTTNGGGFGQFTSLASVLEENTTYYLRAYATNNIGTGYGNVDTFKTDSFPHCGILTDAEGNQYKTVVIGTQCWMRENMKTLKENDYTTTILLQTGSSTATGSSYAYYPNRDAGNYEEYGLLYNMYAALRICPSGWHLPKHADLTTLRSYLTSSLAGYKMKEIGNFHWTNPNYADNSSGFYALGAGFIQEGSVVFGNTAYFYADPENPGIAYYKNYYLYNTTYTLSISEVNSSSNGPSWAYAVRCIRD